MYWMKNICFGIKNTWIWFSVSNVTESAYWTSNIVIMHHYSRFTYILLYGENWSLFYIYHCLNCIWTWIIYEYTINCILNFSKYFSYCFCLILWILCSHLYLWHSVFVQNFLGKINVQTLLFVTELNRIKQRFAVAGGKSLIYFKVKS